MITPNEIELWISVLIPMLPVLAMVLIGMYISDKEADKKKQRETGDPEAYALSWTDLGLYSVLASIFALTSMGTLLSDFLTNFWLSMSIAGGMGLVFRPMLPKLQEIITIKTETVLQAIFK